MENMNTCFLLAFTGATNTAALLLLPTVGQCHSFLPLRAVEPFENCSKVDALGSAIGWTSV